MVGQRSRNFQVPSTKRAKLIPAKAEPAPKIPRWPFSRSTETINASDWPKVYGKIRDKAIKALETENDEAQLTIKALLDERDKLKEEVTKLKAVQESIKNIVTASET
jgi:hypothetical protein